MINLKLDIEDKLWSYLKSETCFQSLYALYNWYPAKDRADCILSKCHEIVDKSHPVANISFDIAKKHEVPAEVRIFEGDIDNRAIQIGCFSGDDFLYIHYHPEILDQYNLSDIAHFITHEIGHFFFRNIVSPAEFFRPQILNNIGLSLEYSVRIQVLANMLGHISEFNADRFAVFSCKSISEYIFALEKLKAHEAKDVSLQKIYEDIAEYRKNNWKTKYLFSHPCWEDRASAFNDLDLHLTDPNFDINQHTEIYDHVLDLLSYHEFINEYSEYYEGNLKFSV